MLQWLLSLDRRVKRLFQVLADCVLITLSLLAAYTLHAGSLAEGFSLASLLPLLVVIPVTILGFAKFGLYRAVVRYISARAIEAIIASVALSAVSLAVLNALILPGASISVAIIFGLILFVAVSGVRFAFRTLFRRNRRRFSVPVLIYGAGESGRKLAARLAQEGEYLPVGFLDDARSRMGTDVAGIRVHSPARVERLVTDLGIKAILLAMPGIDRKRRREVIATLEPLSVEVMSVPDRSALLAGRATLSDVDFVSPEELLGRDPVEPRADLLAANITGRMVLVTGAGGSIGSELCRQILALKPAGLVMLDVSEFALFSVSQTLGDAQRRVQSRVPLYPILGSVQDDVHIRAILRGFRIDTVYHAAAYKHVPLVEHNTVEGVRNNVFGTHTLANAAAECGVSHFILISTDKAVRPTNVMGASKRLAELICQSLALENPGTVFSMVRFGNVLGSSGSVIPSFRAQIRRNGPVTVTHRHITRYFMTTAEAAQLVIQAGAMARGGDVFVLDMGEPVKILDLAKSMIRLHGRRPYVPEDGETGGRSDIAIQFSGLRPGEKLYEELLVGDNATGTEHPLILTANELRLDRPALQTHLDALRRACDSFDVSALRAALAAAPTGYQPEDVVSDLLWQQGQTPAQPVGEGRNLRVVAGRKTGRAAPGTPATRA